MPHRYLDLPKLERLFEAMLGNDVGSVDDARRLRPLKGVYSFFDVNEPVYVGRTMKRGLGPRMSNHIRGEHNQGVLAFKRAKAAFGETSLTRAALQIDPAFKSFFTREIDWVKGLRCNFVELDDENMQYVFEFYAAIRLQTPYNDFGTH